jgi:redox-sensitive bicupin YhaK (pirin superfamily)
LFEGEILHRDSLGSAQPIRPGDVNWMTAGRGIAHSERTDPALRAHTNRLFGIQSWVALPKTQEETVPAFVHHPSATLPLVEDGGMRLRLIAGTGWGLKAPVAVSSPLFYADVALSPGAALPLPEEHEERGAYVLSGVVEVAGTRFDSERMLLFRTGDQLVLRAGPQGARLLLLGGAAMDGPRFIFWNFVSSSRERIEQAKADWQAGRFGKVPGDEHEFIPLP